MEAGFSVNEALSLCTVKEGGNPFKTQNQIALPVSMAMTFAVGQSRMAFFWEALVLGGQPAILGDSQGKYKTIQHHYFSAIGASSSVTDGIKIRGYNISFCWLAGMCIHFVVISPNDEGDEGIKNYNIRGIKGENKTDG